MSRVHRCNENTRFGYLMTFSSHSPYILRFNWNGWRLAKTFNTRSEMEAFQEHIQRVWGTRA